MNAVWWFDDDPDDDLPLYTDVDAESTLGIKANTIRQWKRRGKLPVRGYDAFGRAMFRRDELLALARRTKP